MIQAKEKLQNYDGDVMILCGDTPLLKESTLKSLYQYHKESSAVTTNLLLFMKIHLGMEE